MADTSITFLLGLLGFLILCSAFFSSSETSMMALNRYRLKHLVNKGHKGASKANKLLERPDRLIGVILIGNNFVNILASAIATIIAVRIWGDAGIAIATALLTLVILIFAEVSPKTLAALYPEKIAFPAAYLLSPLLKLIYPLVWLVNSITNIFLKILRIPLAENNNHHLSTEELRTLVNEAGALLPGHNQSMLLGVLALGDVRVNDIMVPRTEVIGINLDEDIDLILQRLSQSPHTRIPVYRGELNQAVGVLHMRNIAKLLHDKSITHQSIEDNLLKPYFIPESTPLQTQLLNFQKNGTRMGLVVDEYGDIEGIVTLADILEEIVGELSTKTTKKDQDYNLQEDGSYFVDGSTYIRDLNKALGWNLPTQGPKSIGGLFTEKLESIPTANACIKLGSYQLESLQISDNTVKTVRVYLLEDDELDAEHQTEN